MKQHPVIIPWKTVLVVQVDALKLQDAPRKATPKHNRKTECNKA